MTEEEIIEKSNKSRESASKGNYESTKEAYQASKTNMNYGNSTHTVITRDAYITYPDSSTSHTTL